MYMEFCSKGPQIAKSLSRCYVVFHLHINDFIVMPLNFLIIFFFICHYCPQKFPFEHQFHLLFPKKSYLTGMQRTHSQHAVFFSSHHHTPRHPVHSSSFSITPEKLLMTCSISSTIPIRSQVFEEYMWVWMIIYSL